MKSIDIGATIRSLIRNESLSSLAKAAGVSKTSARRIRSQYERVILSKEHALKMSVEELRAILRPDRQVVMNYAQPDWMTVYAHVMRTEHPSDLKDEWALYRDSVAEGMNAMSYSTFCRTFRQYCSDLPDAVVPLSMSFECTPGEVLMIDYSGDGIDIVNGDTGEISTAQIFVAVLAHSSYSFCYATARQTRDDWLEAIVKALEFIGGVPQYIFLDNSTSLVVRASKVDPAICAELQGLTDYYDTHAFPLTPNKPKEKAAVERLVGLVQQKVFPNLYGREFFSLEELNRALTSEMHAFNERKLSDGTGQSRLDRFQLEQEYLRELPEVAYDKTVVIKQLKVRTDYCIRYKGHRYSVPHRYVGKTMKVIIHPVQGMIDVFDNNKERRAHHRLKADSEGDSIQREHMPSTHRFVAMTANERREELSLVGKSCEELCRRLTLSQPERVASKTLQGLQSERNRINNDELFEQCCAEALEGGDCSYQNFMKVVDRYLQTQRQQYRLGLNTTMTLKASGAYLRGKDFFKEQA